MHCPDGELQTLGWFALVSYIPDPLARFLDDLRIELVPGSRPKAHVTALPPRPHNHDIKETVQRIDEVIRTFPPFRIETGEMEIFPVSNVVYLSIRHGAEKLHDIYECLNCGELAYRECFDYHPHITIAQDLDTSEADRIAAIAADRWAGYLGPRGFEVSSLSFVQHVAPQIWMDVAALPLGQLTLPLSAK
jgi:2'-5' RNA ligase superfamily